MLRNLAGHEKGMRLLIVFMIAYAFYGLINSFYSLYQMVAPILDVNTGDEAARGDPGFFSPSGNDQNDLWKVVFQMGFTFVSNFMLVVVAATGLYLNRRWGWWLAGTVFFSWLLGVLLSCISILLLIFSDIAPDQFMSLWRLARIFFTVIVSLIALIYLSQQPVLSRFHMTEFSPGKRISILVALAILFFIVCTYSPIILSLF